MNNIINAMTVDVEDYFQVSAFENVIDKNSWNNLDCRVENNTNEILDIFSEANVKATFFTLGWVAERYPTVIKRMVDEGHELASHGYDHVRVTEMSQDQFVEDIKKTKTILEDISGVEVIGYRAPSYSINNSNLWALDKLYELGHRYSSSIYPVKHDLYGVPNAPRFAYYPCGEAGILEIPVTTLALAGRNWPCGGGGYFRLYPYLFSRWALKHVNKQENKSDMFYFHPWEIDPKQPQQIGISRKTRFRHYLNLDKMRHRLERLLNDFTWGRMDTIFLNQRV